MAPASNTLGMWFGATLSTFSTASRAAGRLPGKKPHRFRGEGLGDRGDAVPQQRTPEQARQSPGPGGLPLGPRPVAGGRHGVAAAVGVGGDLAREQGVDARQLDVVDEQGVRPVRAGPGEGDRVRRPRGRR